MSDAPSDADIKAAIEAGLRDSLLGILPPAAQDRILCVMHEQLSEIARATGKPYQEIAGLFLARLAARRN